MAKLSARGRKLLFKMEKPFPPDPGCDQKKVTYYFTDDRRVLVRTSWRFKADPAVGAKTRWGSSRITIVGRVKEGVGPRESSFYQKLITKGYKEVGGE